MTLEKTVFSTNLPRLTAEQSQSVVFQCSDLVLKLNEELSVLDLAISGDIESHLVSNWKGMDLEQLVTKDSRPKIPFLLGDNSAQLNEGSKWRHMNFVSTDGTELPLLVKFFRLAHEGMVTHLVCARDLRPLSNAQRQWQAQQNSMQQFYEKQISQLTSQKDRSFPTKELVKLVGTVPLEELARYAAKYTESLICNEALSRCEGDVDCAAQLLGISPAEFQAKHK